jgi:hypothetical protein
MMKSNIGKIDRLIRLAIALFLLVYAYWQGSWITFGFSVFTFYESWAGGMLSINSSEGAAVLYLSNNFVCKIERYQY